MQTVPPPEIDHVHARWRAPVLGDGAPDLLERVAVALSSSLELGEVLEVLAGIGLEAIAADRASVLLLEGERLVPAAATAVQHDDALFEVFRAMQGIELDGTRASALAAGRAVVISDPAHDALVPDGWAERFSLHTLVVVPLIAGGEPCGVIALDWNEPRVFEPAELRLLETIGAYAGVAVANARLFVGVRRRAQLQGALARAGASLASPLEPEEIADRLAEAYTDLLGSRLAAVALLDLEHRLVARVATRGTSAVVAPMSFDALPESLVQGISDTWAARYEPIDLGHDASLAALLDGDALGVTSYLLLPLVVDGMASGVAVLGFAAGVRIDDEEVAAAEALAAIAAAALERHALVERRDAQLRRLDALHRVSAALTEGAGAAEMVTQLNALLEGHGIEVVGVTFRDRRLARRLGGEEATPVERAAWRANNGPVLLPGDVLAVPMRLGRRLVGMLRVRPATLGAEERAFLEALAGGLAEAANRGVARAEAEEEARFRALAAERDRIRADLHDTAGQMFVALGLLGARHVEELEPGSEAAARAERLVELASQGKWAIDQAIRALAFVPTSDRGLVASLHALARSVESDSGITIGTTVRRIRDLDEQVELALYRVAAEALMNAWRHGDARSITVDLDERDGNVVLTVADDGVGFSGSERRDGSHRGILGMRRVMATVGGCVRIHDGESGGAIVIANVPR